ncbi:MAG: hypothetical protein L0Z50_36195 [Verrucomicrobiales bacterium]|nr:hypothetical protein [Verrucomicrobiales bacterium]
MKNSTTSQRAVPVAVITALFLTAGMTLTGLAAGNVIVQHSKALTFLPAGDVGGGVLEPGTTYPPKGSSAQLKRTEDALRINVQTSGLPAGAYTVWWVIWDNPAGCVDGCGLDDLLSPEPHVSILWSTGGIVGHDGTGHFQDTLRVGDLAGRELVLGDGSFHPLSAEVHLVIKYHGPPSEDPDIL